MKIDYSLTKEDYINFNVFHMDYSKTMRNSIFVQRYLISLVFLIVPFFLSANSQIPFWYWFAVFCITYILWVVFYKRYAIYFLRKRVARMLDEGKNDGLLGARSLSLNENGIASSSAATETKHAWDTVVSVAATDEYIYIYVGAVMAYIVPTRVFAGDEQKTEFLNMVHKYTERHK